MQRVRFWTHAFAFLLLSLFVVIAVGCDGGDSGMDEEPPDETPQGSVEDVRINEIHEGDQWVELFNTSDAEVDVAELWLCVRPAYSQVADLSVLSGTTTIPAGGYLVVEWDAIQSGEGEMGLYMSNTFESADAMLDYLQYGAAEQGRASVAVEAGLWDEGSYATAAAEGQTLAFLGDGSTPVENWGFGAPTQGAENQVSSQQAVQYTLEANANSGALPDGVSATATFQALNDTQSLVTLALDDGPTETSLAHPAHIHLNTAADGGGIEIYLTPIDGLGQPANNGTSTKVVDRPLDELLRFGGHINIHESNANLGNVVARGDIGANARGLAVDAVPLVDSPQSTTYDLAPNPNDGTLPDGVSATAEFLELGDSQTLVTIRLPDGPTDTPLGHPSHIHMNSAADGGGIEIYIAPIDGLAHPNNDATSSQMVDRSYDELTSFDGHINIHESNANLGNVMARGDIGANAQ
jgi:hypothetical protein